MSIRIELDVRRSLDLEAIERWAGCLDQTTLTLTASPPHAWLQF